MPRAPLTLCCLWLSLPLGVCLAHDSPEHVIEDLTRLMERDGRSAPHLYRRACEYRLLGRLEQAAEDLHASIALDAAYFPAHLELGRVQLRENRLAPALETARRAERLVDSPAEEGRVQMLQSEILLASGQTEAALRACDAACRAAPGEVDWRLQHSRLLGQLERHDERLAMLESAIEANPSVVLTIERVEAQLDAGLGTQALEEIERELANSRWRSSWLIRRARVHRQLDEPAAARRDLRTAVAEIDRRLHPERPDAMLLLDRAHAHVLLGRMDAAAADLEHARTAGADPWRLRRLQAEMTAAQPQ
ncbi:tetratricopeptide repeat protein [Alienimonas californiensis]|uniref:Tetratricopeptide repeat protein n=1 Tax=Alienimonas californiensis TaxID=2527989 RepID=A0A517P4G9_9PLAN|nr:hypothetical protein [Alienimonas californiensis]QDT14269.1 Tetratricopeptide repeat protein [Alienimonas californiensis]